MERGWTSFAAHRTDDEDGNRAAELSELFDVSVRPMAE
jgi:hypothetical protein